jgi:hypothetical protein
MHKANVTTIAMGGADKQSLPKVCLNLASERISVKELIERTVKKQIISLREQLHHHDSEIKRMLNRHYLAGGQVDTMAESGKIALPHVKKTPQRERISIEDQQRQALAAFKLGKFKVIVNGNELVSLDDTAILTDNTKITFIRIIPLTGG